jgi:hypothetical protein
MNVGLYAFFGLWTRQWGFTSYLWNVVMHGIVTVIVIIIEVKVLCEDFWHREDIALWVASHSRSSQLLRMSPDMVVKASPSSKESVAFGYRTRNIARLELQCAWH